MTTNEIKIYVPAETIENPAETIEQLNPDNIIFDFKKIITKPVRQYVAIIIVKLYKYDDEYRFDIENKKDAYPIIKDFIVNKENSTELVFQVGFCEKPLCVKGCYNLPDFCCTHRIASFKYEENDYTYIEGYSDTIYRIKIIL